MLFIKFEKLSEDYTRLKITLQNENHILHINNILSFDYKYEKISEQQLNTLKSIILDFKPNATSMTFGENYYSKSSILKLNPGYYKIKEDGQLFELPWGNV